MRGLAEEFHPEVGPAWTSSPELWAGVSCWKEVLVRPRVPATAWAGQDS